MQKHFLINRLTKTLDVFDSLPINIDVRVETQPSEDVPEYLEAWQEAGYKVTHVNDTSEYAAKAIFLYMESAREAMKEVHKQLWSANFIRFVTTPDGDRWGYSTRDAEQMLSFTKAAAALENEFIRAFGVSMPEAKKLAKLSQAYQHLFGISLDHPKDDTFESIKPTENA